MLPVNCAKADPQANPRNAIRVMESQSFNLVAMLTPLISQQWRKRLLYLAKFIACSPDDCQAVSNGFTLENGFCRNVAQNGIRSGWSTGNSCGAWGVAYSSRTLELGLFR